MLITHRPIVRAAFAALGFVLVCPAARAELVPGSMAVSWNAGAPDCRKNPPPPLQVHRYNDRTFILRENPCATYEAPFLYLLIGSTRAALIDTGAVADAAAMPLVTTVRSLLAEAGPPVLPLLIVHTHGHLDHRSGDAQFAGEAGVEIVGTSLDEVRRHFHFDAWPSGVAQIDLGNRTIDVIPTPGHYVSELSYYDRATGLFFSGDFLLPGRLLIEDRAAELASARRVVQFIAQRPVRYVLGGHIELDRAGNTFFGDHFHPDERPLELTKVDLLGLPVIVADFNGFLGQNGPYVLMNQNRVLLAVAVVALAIVVALGFGIRWLVRRFWSRSA